jgi:hypothetical protein
VNEVERRKQNPNHPKLFAKIFSQKLKESVKIKQRNLSHLKIFGNEGKADEDPHSEGGVGWT